MSTTFKIPFAKNFPRPRRSAIIAGNLRQGIVDGKLPPGQQLPTLSDLETRYGVSRITVQRAFDRLRVEGFIESRGRHGTFVTLSPPHLKRYGCVLIQRPLASGSSKLFVYIENAMRRICERHRAQSAFYYFRTTDSPDFQRFCRDVELSRLAGVIYMQEPSPFREAIKKIAPTLPSVCFLLIKPQKTLGMTSFFLDPHCFLKVCLKEIKRRNLHTCACLLPLSTQWTPQSFLKTFHPAARDYGVKTRLDWLSVSSLDHTEWMLPWLCALASSSPAPKALIIWDDHLVESCTRLLKKHCPKFAMRLLICAHANFPDISRSHLDSFRFGIDWDEAFEQAFALLNRQQRGPTAPLNRRLAVKSLMPR